MWTTLVCASAIAQAQGAQISKGDAGTYRVEASQSDLYVVVRKARGRLLSGLSHDHVIVAESFSGEVRWAHESPDACSVRIEVPVESLVVDPEAKRRELEFERSLDEGDKKAIRKNMLAKGQLWAERHSAVTFEGTDCAAREGGVVVVRGALTIRGVSLDLSLPLEVTFEDESLRARTDFRRVHRDFGFEPDGPRRRREEARQQWMAWWAAEERTRR